MKIVTPICGNTVVIAYQAENNRTQVRFDLSDIVREFPGGTAALVIRRHGDTDPVPAASAVMDGTALGTVATTTTNGWTSANFDVKLNAGSHVLTLQGSGTNKSTVIDSATLRCLRQLPSGMIVIFK